MTRIPQILILASSDEWLAVGTEDRPSGWSEWWSATANPSTDFALVVAPPSVELSELIRWRSEARDVDLLIITREGDPRLTRFFGDDGVFFLHPPRLLGELRSGVQEVLNYREACRKLADEGRASPRIDEQTSVSGWLELTGPSHPVFLRRFRNWIESLASLPLDAQDVQRLIHAVREIGWNAIEWGNRFDPGRALSLSFLALEDRILFRIQNENSQGSGGNWYAEQEKIRDAGELQRVRAERGIRPGGLGLAMAKSIVDEIQVSSHGNIVILQKNLPGRPRASEPAREQEAGP